MGISSKNRDTTQGAKGEGDPGQTGEKRAVCHENWPCS